MPKSLSYDDVIKVTRYVMYEAVTTHSMISVDPVYIAGRIGMGLTASYVILAFTQLADLGDIEIQRTAKTTAKLTPQGARSAEAELRKKDSLVSQYLIRGTDALEERLIGVDLLPASDRFVDKNHNQSSRDQAISELAELENELISSNEAGEVLGDQREAIVAEVSALRKLIEASKTRIGPTVALAQRTLGWISEKGAAAAIGELAKRALAHILAWLAMNRRTDISSILIVNAALALSACATPRMHSAAELNSAGLACGLTYGELIQDAEAKKLLILFREAPAPEKRACVYEWARARHLKLVVIDSIKFPEGP